MAPKNILKTALVATGILTGIAGFAIFASATVSEESATPATSATSNQDSVTEYSDRMKEIRDLLENIPTGREALRVIDEHGVEVSFVSGEGSFYAFADNTVVIDIDAVLQKAALLVVHEATHVSYHKQGLWLRPEDVGRNEYVDARLIEEADAEANVVEAKLELNVEMTKSSTYVEREYRKAYSRGIEQQMMTNESGTNEEWEQSARDAAQDRLRFYFLKVQIIRSTDGLSYSETYENHWDAVTISVTGIAGDLNSGNPIG